MCIISSQCLSFLTSATGAGSSLHYSSEGTGILSGSSFRRLITCASDAWITENIDFMMLAPSEQGWLTGSY